MSAERALEDVLEHALGCFLAHTPHNPQSFWGLAADEVRQRYLAEHDRKIKAEVLRGDMSDAEIEAAARAIHQTYCHGCDPTHECQTPADCKGHDSDDWTWAQNALLAARAVRLGGDHA